MEAAKKSLNNRSNLEPETLQDLQECLYDWQNYNFGEQDNARVLLGICEEIGELAHAQLKLEQGIRGDAEKLHLEMRDAIGDVMIYSLNYLSRIEGTIGLFPPLTDVKPSDELKPIHDCIFACVRFAAKLTIEPENERMISQIAMMLNRMCALKGWDFETIIRETWQKVGGRDWKQYPETGLPTDSAEK